GSAAAFLGAVHFTLVAADWTPYDRAALVAALAHATLTALVALALRRRERVFAQPLRITAMLATLPAAALLLIPTASLALEWAGCAVWLALIWLTLALVWRERGAFPVFQVALALAAVLAGVAWLAAQEAPPESALAYWQPAALHVYAVAVGLLALAWVAA